MYVIIEILVLAINDSITSTKNGNIGQNCHDNHDIDNIVPPIF